MTDGPSVSAVPSIETRGDADSLSVGQSSKNDFGSLKEMPFNKVLFSECADMNEDCAASEKVVNREDVLINLSDKKYEKAKD